MKQKADLYNYNLRFSNLVLTHITGYAGLKFHNVCISQDCLIIVSSQNRRLVEMIHKFYFCDNITSNVPPISLTNVPVVSPTNVPGK